MAYYCAAQHCLLLSPVFKLWRGRESLKRDRKPGLGHKIGLGELNYWRE